MWQRLGVGSEMDPCGILSKVDKFLNGFFGWFCLRPKTILLKNSIKRKAEKTDADEKAGKSERKRIPLGSDYPTKTIAGRLVRISAISARLSFVLHSCRGFCGFVCARICFAVVVPVHFHLNNQINLIGFFVVVEIRAIYWVTYLEWTNLLMKCAHTAKWKGWRNSSTGSRRSSNLSSSSIFCSL